MWFVWLAIGLVLVTVAGLFVRRRVVEAAGWLGLSPRGQRIVRWAIAWLLFAYPVIMFATVGISLALGADRLSGADSALFTWGLLVPFFFTVLTVLQAAPWVVAVYTVRRVRRMPPSRRGAAALLAPVVAFAIYTPARIAWQHDELRWRTHQLQLEPRDPAVPPLRIGFIADLQLDANLDADRVDAVLARLNASRPDLVLSGGDWINQGPAYIARAGRAAGQLRAPLGTFSVLGDHEHFAYFDRDRSTAEVRAAMAEHHVEMLHNQVRRFDHHGRTIAVIFLTYSYPSRTPDAVIEELLASVQDADVRILVTHQLTAHVADLARDRVQLILAAHTHGGQINPVVGLVHVPLARLETPYVDGRYQLGTTTIIVTAGVGYSIVPFRYASPGSVELIDLVW